MRTTLRLSRILKGLFISITVFLMTTGSLLAAEEGLETDAPSLAIRQDKGWVSAGLFFADFNTNARLDGRGGRIGTSIDLEEDLGMDSNSELWTIGAGLYFSQRWRFETEYLNHKRASIGEVSREINWGDQTIEAGVKAIAKFEVSITRIALGYDFVQKEDRLIGASVGLHWVKSLAALQGEGTITGGLPASDPGFGIFLFDFDAAAISDEKLPLPNFGLYGSYAIGKRWRLNGRADVFMLDLGEWGGEFLSAYVDLSYMAKNGFYCGAGLQYLVINVDYESNRLDGRIHYRHFGPRVDIGFRF